MSVLMYGAEMWTLTGVDLGKLKLFNMICRRELLNIRWSDHVTNKSVRELTGLLTIDDYLSRRRLPALGHIAWLDAEVHANDALRLAIDVREGRRPDPNWSRRQSRLRRTREHQVRDDAGILLSSLWFKEVARGHGAT